MLADAWERQPGTAAGQGLRGSASQQRADLLEVAPVGGLVRHHPAELAVHRIVEDGTPEAVAVQRLDELGAQPQVPQPAGPLRRGRRRERGGSTLMTSAPRSARISAASGPATNAEKSTTRNPASSPIPERRAASGGAASPRGARGDSSPRWGVRGDEIPLERGVRGVAPPGPAQR